VDDWTLVWVGWLLFAGLVAALAVTWNRSGAKWFLFSVLLSPLLGFLVLVFSGKRPADAPPDRLKLASSGPLTWILVALVVLGLIYIVLAR
jgi:hypothetical protein